MLSRGSDYTHGYGALVIGVLLFGALVCAFASGVARGYGRRGAGRAAMGVAVAFVLAAGAVMGW